MMKSKEDRIEFFMSRMLPSGIELSPAMDEPRSTVPRSIALNATDIDFVLSRLPIIEALVLRSRFCQDAQSTIELVDTLVERIRKWGISNRWDLDGIDLEGAAWGSLYRIVWRTPCRECCGRSYRIVRQRVEVCGACSGTGEASPKGSEFARLVGVSPSVYAKTWRYRIDEIRSRVWIWHDKGVEKALRWVGK